jgi:hypothetical protein
VITLSIATVPTIVVRTSLTAARLPLTLAEKVMRPAANGEWPPTVAFASFEASVKQLAGSVLRDETLSDEGKLLHAKVRRLHDAVQLETIAEQRKAAADAVLDRERDAADTRRREADERARRAKAESERDAKLRATRADEATRAEKARVERAAAAERNAIAKRERAAKAGTLDVERSALSKKRAALAADAKVVKADKAIAATKAARKRR